MYSRIRPFFTLQSETKKLHTKPKSSCSCCELLEVHPHIPNLIHFSFVAPELYLVYGYKSILLGLYVHFSAAGEPGATL